MSEQQDNETKPVPLMVRLPPTLHAAIKELAAKQRRSLNAECIVLLEFAVSLLANESDEGFVNVSGGKRVPHSPTGTEPPE